MNLRSFKTLNCLLSYQYAFGVISIFIIYWMLIIWKCVIHGLFISVLKQIIQWKSSLARSKGSDSDHLRMECWEPLWVRSWPRESLLWATGQFPKQLHCWAWWSGAILGSLSILKWEFWQTGQKDPKWVCLQVLLSAVDEEMCPELTRPRKRPSFSGVVSGWGCCEFSLLFRRASQISSAVVV